MLPSNFVRCLVRAKTPASAIATAKPIIHVARTSSSLSYAAPRFAFVFDIDGVLIQGPNILPAAQRALNILDGQNAFKAKIPYLLLTNGGGVSEQDRCRRLTKQLGVPISLDQYVQAHTILSELSSKYADQPVLVLGGKLNSVREVAESYGFQKVYNTLDVLAWNPAVWPFYQISQAEREVAKPVDFLQTPIAAIFVFHDPRNWALDVQVLCDVILSGGIIGGPFVHPDKRPELELVFCNPDLLWRSDFSRPRLGQGAFKEAFQAVYTALTGSRYPHVQFGKPTIATYKFAEKMMLQHLKQMYGSTKNLPKMYMVGDNPASDIAGANAAGWSSVLVRTGVYDPLQGPPSHKPTHEAENVESAVEWVLERELARTTGVKAN